MTEDPPGFHLPLSRREAETPAGNEQADGSRGLIQMIFYFHEHGHKLLGGKLSFQVEMEQAIRVEVDLVSAHVGNINDKCKIINQISLEKRREQKAEAGLKSC